MDGYAMYGGSPAAVATNRWWTEEDPASSVVAHFQRIEQDQNARLSNDAQWARAYENQDLRTLYESGIAVGMMSHMAKNIGHNVTFNVTQSCVDAAAAKIAKNRPRALFLTSGGDHDMQERARGMTKFTDGCFYLSDTYNEGQKAFIDSAVFGTGVIKVFWDDDSASIRSERVLPGEIFVEDTEAIHGKPRSMYQRKFIFRDVLMEMVGKDEKKRAAIAFAHGGNPGISIRAIDMIPVVEAWHLPSSKKAKDGRHVLCIDNCTLFDEKWTKDYFPFAMFPWVPRLVGIWGRGVAEMLHGIQKEINKLLERIQQSQHRIAVPRVFLPAGSKVIKSHLNNEVAAIVEYAGDRPPVIDTSNAVPGELYSHLERLYNRAFEITGISQLSAASKKPPGLNAGVALREFHDIESERFVLLGQRYEQLFLDIARMMIDIAREKYASNKPVRVKAPGTRVLETIDWKDVDLTEDAYVMKVFPTSILPTTPAGRLQKVQELHEAGFINRDQAQDLLDFPDLEATVSLTTASVRDIRRILDRIISDGKYETPEPFMDLKLAVKMAQSAYLRARTEGVSEGRLEKLRRFMDECAELMAPPPQEAAPEPVLPAPPEGAPGEMPPQFPPGPPAVTDGPPGPPMSPFEPQAGAPVVNPMEAGSPAVPSMLPGGPTV